MAVSKHKSFFWAGCNYKFNDSYLTFAITVGFNTSSLAFFSPSVAFNNCLAGLIGLALIFSPLKLGLSLRKARAKKVYAKEEQEQKEGGESQV